MATKTIKTRIVLKHDTEEHWLLATNFIPMMGEVIVYDADASHTTARFKIGDGSTAVSLLPFVVEPIDEQLNSFAENFYTKAEVDATLEEIKEIISNQDIVILAEAQSYADKAIEDGLAWGEF